MFSPPTCGRWSTVNTSCEHNITINIQFRNCQKRIIIVLTWIFDCEYNFFLSINSSRHVSNGIKMFFWLNNFYLVLVLNSLSNKREVRMLWNIKCVFHCHNFQVQDQPKREKQNSFCPSNRKKVRHEFWLIQDHWYKHH